jgi:hypothetical protein
MDADQVKALLGLEPNPSCGFTTPTYTSPLRVETPRGGRDCAFAQYFLVAPERAMVMHRIRSDQLYHHYAGDPLEVLRLHEDGSADVTVVGSNLVAGELPQLLIPAQTFHVSRVVPGGSWALLATTVIPGLVPEEDVELGDLEKLVVDYPGAAEQIRSFSL